MDKAPSAAAINKIITGIRFTPRKDKMLAIFARQGSPEYYEHQAIMDINMAQEAREAGDPDTYEKYMRSASRSLVMAQYYGGTDAASQPEKKR